MDVYGLSHVGKIRKLNEDNYYVSMTGVGAYENLFIIADGMGGHNAGEIASQLAVDSFLKYIEEKNQGETEDTFIKGVEYANEQIYRKSIAEIEYHGMGTTFVACCINSATQKMHVVNVGDSRLYALIHQLDQITIDHSYVEELVRSGDITREESLNHPDKNIITRALGTSNQVSVDQFVMSVHKVNKILLCSDGLSNMINHQVLEQAIAKDATPKQIVEELLELALEAGGSDNITLILIDFNRENTEVD